MKGVGAKTGQEPEIEITPEMEAAGLQAMTEWYEGCEDLREGALMIFRAMLAARKHDKSKS